MQLLDTNGHHKEMLCRKNDPVHYLNLKVRGKHLKLYRRLIKYAVNNSGFCILEYVRTFAVWKTVLV